MGYVDYLQELKQANGGNELAVRQKLRMTTLGYYRMQVEARTRACLVTDTPFTERLVHFWANHFAVSIDKAPLGALAGAFEVEAIRPHVMGRFEDMLLAVERHPAMLLYLDQARSIGPTAHWPRAAVVKPERQRGLNENLAREILELHTLGVRSGYDQERRDRARARAHRLERRRPAGFAARAARPAASSSSRSCMNRGRARCSAGSTSNTARPRRTRSCTTSRRARPRRSTLRASWPAISWPTHRRRRWSSVLPMRSRAAVASCPLCTACWLTAPDAWSAQAPKFKTPWDWMVLVAARPRPARARSDPCSSRRLLVQLGQPVWRPGSPAGYDDVMESWAAPDA